MNKDNFLFPQSRYRGVFSPELLVFNANLQEFAHKAGYICALQTNGKLSAASAYAELEKLWKDLASSKDGLNIGDGT
jgi:hypothetical protein